MHQIRPAIAADAPRICELIYAQSGSEAVILLGAIETARRFGELVMQAQPSLGWKNADVAEVDSEVVGVLQHGPGSDDPPVDAALVRGLMATLGLAATWRLLARGWAVQRVRVPPPPDTWVVRELHVDAAVRSQGLGGAMLAHAQHRAVDEGIGALSLSVRSDNPARHLYHRAGYRVMASRTSRRYERLTGARGRVLMVKTLPSV